MMQLNLIHEITSLLTQSSIEVSDKSKLKLYDINVLSEDVFAPILSIVFDTNLRNLNSELVNHPSIDLATDDALIFGDSKKKIAIQITSDKSAEKIKKTLLAYVKAKLYDKYDELYIYNLVEKQKSYNKKTISEIKTIVSNKFSFDIKRNVIDKSDLAVKIKTIKAVPKIESICKLLKDQYVYKRKSLLSLDIWESEGKLGYGFSNLLNSIDLTTYQTLVSKGVSIEVRDLLELIFKRYNNDFSKNYFQNQIDVSRNLAFNTYLKAGFEQALDSYETVKKEITSSINIEEFASTLNSSLNKFKQSLDESDYPLVNQATNHPAIKFIKETITQIFLSAKINDDILNLFIKDFNAKILNTIVHVFGEDNYNKHLQLTKDKWIRENEKEFLVFLKNNSRLGFVDGEELQFQETFGYWEDVRNYNSIEEDNETSPFQRHPLYPRRLSEIETIDKNETKLKEVESLIEEYFDSYKNEKEGYLSNILFLISDFGKGKTSFLKAFAAKLAQQYLKTNEGLFPVYLNLNEYDKYSNSPSLGIIANYLAKAHKIDVKDDYFKKKNYIFLIDSLDECGELTESKIELVVKDILEIQNLDCINQRGNRIIIATRPIAKGLKEQISKYKPFRKTIKDEHSKGFEETENYVSIYGFKKMQFNSYVEFALRKHLSRSDKKVDVFSGLSQKIVSRIDGNESIMLYEELLRKVLKQSELKRPIFAYMIYKLIISNSNFFEFGKVGVYISFLNQLSRDAKHKDDLNHKVSIRDEFVYRNILHASALLWQYKRQSGEQTSLTKADICRTIEEKELDKDDRKVMQQFNDIESVHFLSHSYLGEKENTLHFQHQSFAEILLAEYYLKTIIKYAIEEDTDFEEARIRLSVGLPTDQTVDFFKGLLTLVKECTDGNLESDKLYSKRELLIPLLASMAIKKHNKKLYSTRLNTTWFDKFEEEIFAKNKISDDIIVNFPITQSVLCKIETLCKNIIESEKTYLLKDSQNHTVLFKNELISVSSINGNYHEIDKWLALIAGNVIGTDTIKGKFFNSKIDSNYLFELLKNWNVNSGYIPIWGQEYFSGISMEKNTDTTELRHLDLFGVNFSNSYFKKTTFDCSKIINCDFSNSKFEYFNISESVIRSSKFDNIEIIGDERKNGLQSNKTTDLRPFGFEAM